MRPTIPLRTRLESRIDRSGGPDSCWEWTGPKDLCGYGRLGRGGHGAVKVGAHRTVWELEVGEIPAGMCICHRCDNPGCCNIKHLFMGTHNENVQDCIRKGRRKSPRGEAHGSARLTDSDVFDIREKLSRGTKPKELAKAYGVARRSIAAINTGLTWKHLV